MFPHLESPAMARTAILQLLLLAHLFEISFAERKWDGLRVRFSLSKLYGFYELPLNTSSEVFGDYVKVEKEAGYNLPVDIYCFLNDPRGCLIVDKPGNVVGFQIGFLKDDFADIKPEDFDVSKTTNFILTNHFNIPAYCFRVYFTHPEKLTNKGRKKTTEIADGVWIYIDGELFEVPRQQPSTPVFKNFYKQVCISRMGQHYFHGVNENVTNCKTIFPLFFLYDDNSLVGFGISTIGKGSVGPKRDWYERATWFELEALLPSPPSCLIDLARDYGTMFMHVYMVDKPWKISCNVFYTIINEVLDWIPFL